MAWFDIPAGALHGMARGTAAPVAAAQGGGDFAALMAGTAPAFAAMSPPFTGGAPGEEQAESVLAEGEGFPVAAAIPWPAPPPDPPRAGGQGDPTIAVDAAIGDDSAGTGTIPSIAAPAQPSGPFMPDTGPESVETSLTEFPGASLRFIRPVHAAPLAVVEFVPMDDFAAPPPVADTAALPALADLPGAGEVTAGPAPRADTALPQAQAPLPAPAATTPAAAAPPLPHPPLRRIAEAARQGDGMVELRLDPPELGTLRLMLMPEGDTIRATIHADRPETLDLLRRNAAELAAEFRAAGFGGAVLDFGTPGFAGGGGGGDRPARDAPPPPPPPAIAAADTPARPRPAGLDLRL